MKFKKIFLFFSFALLICFVVQLQAVEQPRAVLQPQVQSFTVESAKILDVLKHVDKNTLVIFDIDGVVFEPKQTLGNSPWGYYEAEKYIQAAGDKRKGLTKYCDVWKQVQEKVSVELIDKKLLEVLKELKEKEIPAIAFTARGMRLFERTQEQLKSIGVNFEENSYHDKEEIEEFFHYDLGVLFVLIGFNKGEGLKLFFEKIKKRPSKIVFVDDREHRVTSMQKMCKEEKIDFVGIRYGGADRSVTNFNGKLGDIQLYFMKNFDTILTDEQAENMLSFFENLIKNGGDFLRQT